MGKFRNKLANFMRGRYGMDNLYYFLIALIFVLMIIYTFTRKTIFYVIELVLFIIVMFRTFSRNYNARRKEDELYLSLTKPVRSFFSLFKRRVRDRNSYRYRKCPNCHQVLRLPIRKGKNTVKCPKCGKTFEVRI